MFATDVTQGMLSSLWKWNAMCDILYKIQNFHINLYLIHTENILKLMNMK